MEKIKKYLPVLFVLVELFLYGIILFSKADHIEIYCYMAIIVAFLFSAVYVQDGKYNYLCLIAFIFTLIADFFLVVNGKSEYKGVAMTSFLFVQFMYATYIYLTIENKKNMKVGITLRLSLTFVAVLATILVLKSNVDYLSIVSIIYFANLICNIIDCIINIRTMRLLLTALVLFMLCDVVTGLSVADGLYFVIPATSLLSKIIYLPFNLIWFFYVPSQVLIALNLNRKKTSEAKWASFISPYHQKKIKICWFLFFYMV